MTRPETIRRNAEPLLAPDNATDFGIPPEIAGLLVQALRFERDPVPDASVVRGLQRLADSPRLSLAAVCHRERVEIGDLESLLQTAIWLDSAIVSLARLVGFEEAALIGEPALTSWQTRATRT